MRYKCLALDHDDTFVKSTPTVNYPSFVETMRQLRPEKADEMTYERFIKLNYSPGFHELCRDILGYSEKEMELEYSNWLAYSKEHMPDVYGGMPQLVKRQREEGGIVAVISHSDEINISRDYLRFTGKEPDFMFGWNVGDGKRKPDPWCINEIIRRTGLKASDILVVDDLLPGLMMAKSAGCDFAGAGWSHTLPEISRHMSAECSHYFRTTDELFQWQFESGV